MLLVPLPGLEPHIERTQACDSVCAQQNEPLQTALRVFLQILLVGQHSRAKRGGINTLRNKTTNRLRMLHLSSAIMRVCTYSLFGLAIFVDNGVANHSPWQNVATRLHQWYHVLTDHLLSATAVSQTRPGGPAESVPNRAWRHLRGPAVFLTGQWHQGDGKRFRLEKLLEQQQKQSCRTGPQATRPLQRCSAQE